MEAQMYNYSSWVTETDPQILQVSYEVMLKKAGFKILGKVEHYFKPQGYTCLYLLAESHFAVHTFPECGKTYIELSSCVKKQFDVFIKKNPVT